MANGWSWSANQTESIIVRFVAFVAVGRLKWQHMLKEIAKTCGIEKHLTFHLSRHTFATLTMSKGVSLESVSKMLGHKNIQTTQIYAKMTTEKVGRDMAIFAESIKETERKFVVNF